MATILFASNNPVHWTDGANTNSASSTDLTRVPFSIQLNRDLQNTTDFLQSGTGETWIHFRMNSGPQGSGASVRRAFTIQDQLDRTIWYMNNRSNTPGGTFYSDNQDGLTNSTNAGSVSASPTWDIQVIHGAFEMGIRVYVNLVLTYEHLFGVNSGNVTGVNKFSFGNSLYQSSSGGGFSEFIVSDGDTRGARLNTVRPVSIGAYNDWFGNVPDLVDQNLNTGLTTTANNDRTSLIMEPYPNTEIISNVVISSTHRRGINSPEVVRHFLRFNGIDYDNPTLHPVSILAELTQDQYEINPATSLPWNPADVLNTEFGFKSET